MATRNGTDVPQPRPELMRFAAWLRTEMARRRIGVNALAQRLEVSGSAVSQYRRALRFPRADAQQRLAAFFKIDLAEIEALLPTESDSFVVGSSQLSAGIMDSLADQVAERTAGAVLRSLEPLFHHYPPAHFTEDEWLRHATRRVIERVEGTLMAAGDPGAGGGQSVRGERQVLWEVRVRGACMEPVIPDGCSVLVDRRTAEPGETVAVLVGDDVMVKRLAVHNGERVLATADGRIVRTEQARVMGVVCYVPAPRYATELR